MIDAPAQSYDDPVILLGGGELNRELFAQTVAHGYPLVAADGGANALTPDDPTPDLIIGDLDSLEGRADWEARTKVHEIAEQDSTDFEKCLYATAAPLYLAFGFLGRRFDHSLAALHVLAKFAETKNVVLIGQQDLVVAPGPNFVAELDVGTRFSVFPLTPVSFAHSDGLAYPLDGLTLAPGTVIGTSNKVSASTVTIATDGAPQARYAVILPANCLTNITSNVASGGRSV